MIAIIDTIFAPVLNWLTQILNMLQSANIPPSYNLALGNIFAPFNMISFSWSMLITNIFVMIVTYTIIYIVVSASSLFANFKKIIKWW